MRILSLVKVRNFAVSQCWARAQNALFVRKIVENHILFVLKMPILVPSSHSLTTFCTKGCYLKSRPKFRVRWSSNEPKRVTCY